jgi:hypothetical protein
VVKPQLTLVENTGGWRGPTNERTVPRTGETKTHNRAESVPRESQLDLFSGPTAPELRVFIVAMETVHGRTLHGAVASHRPRSVIDLRYAARFDQYGSDRDTLFSYFRSVGAYYALDSMPWHDLSPRDFMKGDGGLVPRVHDELLVLAPGAVMLFVQKPQHAGMLASYLNRMLSEKAKTSWLIEQIC